LSRQFLNGMKAALASDTAEARSRGRNMAMSRRRYPTQEPIRRFVITTESTSAVFSGGVHRRRRRDGCRGSRESEKCDELLPRRMMPRTAGSPRTSIATYRDVPRREDSPSRPFDPRYRESLWIQAAKLGRYFPADYSMCSVSVTVPPGPNASGTVRNSYWVFGGHCLGSAVEVSRGRRGAGLIASPGTA
jgi:hypothetical protein